MNGTQSKFTFVFIPFGILFLSILVINILHQLNSDPLDTEWSSRQIIIGLFIFVGFSFVPRFLKLKVKTKYPWIHFSLSHHSILRRVNHELKIGNWWICTGCVGTSIGLICGISLLISYFFLPSLYSSRISLLLFIVGILMVIITYLRYIILLRPFVRLIQHSSLFLGITLLIISVDLYFESALFLALLIPSWAVFLLARVKLSSLSH